MQAAPAETARIVTGRSSRFAAMQMDLGNMISMLLPPLPLLWFGGSMLIYALHRHHPNPRVGHYTQRAAYRFYAVMGAIIPDRHLFPRAWHHAMADRLGRRAGGDHPVVALVDFPDPPRGMAGYRGSR